MKAYEVMYILNPELEEEAIVALVNKFNEIVTSGGGELVKVDQWGKRRLAYEIKDRTEGYYVVLQFKAESSVAQELDRVFKITDEVLRYLIIRKDG